MKGKLIVIEGTDCSGKETQTKKAIDFLKSKKIKIESFTFPNYDSPTGKIIGGPYLGKEYICSSYFKEGASLVEAKVASLYYVADRLYNIKPIEDLLNSGVNVILDRYIYSNMAHQGGKVKNKKEMYNFLEKLEFELLKLPKPDIAVFLHMPTDMAKPLKENRKESLDGHEKDINHLYNAEEAYLELSNRYNMHKIECIKNNEIRSIDDISNEICEYLISKLK